MFPRVCIEIATYEKAIVEEPTNMKYIRFQVAFIQVKEALRHTVSPINQCKHKREIVQSENLEIGGDF